MCGLCNESTFSSHTYCRQGVITSDHPTCQMRCAKRLDSWASASFEFVFEDDEAEETEV